MQSSHAVKPRSEGVVVVSEETEGPVTALD
jgi:hypothetical protein